MLIADITQGVEDRYSLAAIPTAKMNRFIASGVRYYSRYAPYVTLYEFDTVKDQSNYDLPAGCTVIIDLLWPAGELLTTVNIGQERALPHRYNFVSERVIEDIKKSAFYAGRLGDWRRENQEVVLVPTPSVTSTGDEVQLWYGKVHAVNDAELGYNTIPDADLDILTDLTLAEVLSQQRIEGATRPNYREGQGAVWWGHTAKNTKAVIVDLRSSVSNKYGDGQLAVRSWGVG